jgi:hypothetical protein
MQTPNRGASQISITLWSNFSEALDEFFRGNPEPSKLLMSHRDDVTLAIRSGPTVRGWKRVNDVMDRAGSNYVQGFQPRASRWRPFTRSELACTVRGERFQPIGKQEIVSSLCGAQRSS